MTLKLGRLKNQRKIPGLINTSGHPFFYMLSDCELEIIHDIDSRARGQVAVHEKVTITDDRNRYIISSLIEEAVTSSQLEGAATTRKVVVQMLRSGRATKANK